MAEKPILFNTPMVRAILEDRKNTTRRVVKDPYYIDDEQASRVSGLAMHKGTNITHGMPYEDQLFSPGDILWVRETFRVDPVFAALREKWRALEWNDGGICAFLPSKAADLVQEGRVLHHCVGGYSSQHCGGELIVFIRHARRPERSWFTLNIDTKGPQWREIQLHGYGNEHAHGKLLKIPSEVRAFVDRWEKEVLTPVFRQIKREEAARERKGKARVRIPA